MNAYVPKTGTLHRGARCSAATLFFAPAGNRRMSHFVVVDDAEVERLLDSHQARLCKSCERIAVGRKEITQ